MDESPSFLAMPDSLQVAEGDQAVLICKARGQPVPTITWMRANTPIEELDNVSIKTKSKKDKLEIESTLTLKEIWLTDEDNAYTIVAENSVGQAVHEFGLTVLQMPEFVQVPELMELVKGIDAEVEVKAIGKPLPQLVWSKDGRKIKEHVHVEEMDGEMMSKYLLKAVSLDDEGTYQVKATNEAGTTKCDVLISGKFYSTRNIHN